LRNENTKSKRGSGLGLYLCLQIAEQHGGAIDASSEAGTWARFTLRLPARDGGYVRAPRVRAPPLAHDDLEHGAHCT